VIAPRFKPQIGTTEEIGRASAKRVFAPLGWQSVQGYSGTEDRDGACRAGTGSCVGVG
jgi:hypothetical protein